MFGFKNVQLRLAGLALQGDKAFINNQSRRGKDD